MSEPKKKAPAEKSTAEDLDLNDSLTEYIADVKGMRFGALRQKIRTFETFRVGKASFSRRTLVALCVVLGVLAVPLGAVATWAVNTISSQDKYVSAVSNLAQDTQIQEQVATDVTQLVMDRVNLQGVVDNAGGGVLSQINDLVANINGTSLVEELEAAIEPRLSSAVTKFVQSNAFQSVWTTANSQAHAAVLGALQNDTSGVQGIAADGSVTLNLNSVLSEADLSITDIAPIDQALDDMNVSVPLLGKEQVSTLRGYFDLATNLSVWAPIVAGIALLAALIFARKRWLVVAAIGAAFILSAFLPQIAAWYLNTSPPEALTGNGLASMVGLHLSDQVLGQMSQSLGYALPIGVGVLVLGIIGTAVSALVSRSR